LKLLSQLHFQSKPSLLTSQWTFMAFQVNIKMKECNNRLLEIVHFCWHLYQRRLSHHFPHLQFNPWILEFRTIILSSCFIIVFSYQIRETHEFGEQTWASRRRYQLMATIRTFKKFFYCPWPWPWPWPWLLGTCLHSGPSCDSNYTQNPDHQH